MLLKIYQEEATLLDLEEEVFLLVFFSLYFDGFSFTVDRVSLFPRLPHRLPCCKIILGKLISEVANGFFCLAKEQGEIIISYCL